MTALKWLAKRQYNIIDTAAYGVFGLLLGHGRTFTAVMALCVGIVLAKVVEALCGERPA